MSSNLGRLLCDALRGPAGGARPSIDEAIAAAFEADRLGTAFATGYRAALRTLAPSLPADGIVSLAATEAGGAHPRAIAERAGGERGAGARREAEGRPSAIASTLVADATSGAFRLSGTKTFATMAPEARTLIVIAGAGMDASGRNRLTAVRIAANAAGVTIAAHAPTAFTPEVTHGEVRLVEVAVAADEVLPGDGYTAYLKPFRTLEDGHVHAALLAYVLGVARRSGWPPHTHEDLLALLAALRSIAGGDPGAPPVHLALAGLLRQTRRLLDETRPHWALVEPDERARWERDQPLLAIAERARTQRTAAAWRDLPAVPVDAGDGPGGY